ncbi:MAG: hypothetical protein ACYCW6_18645 [Candidatus Xenobia bacterium]
MRKMYANPMAQTPWLDRNLQFFENRDMNGLLQGNLNPQEQQVLGADISQFQQQLATDDASGITPQERQQLWQEARGINQDIFSLRHNDLGSMGPGGPNAQAPHLLTPNNPGPGGPTPTPISPPTNCCGCNAGPTVPNTGAAGSLNGVSVWGDPHITDQNGNQTNFSQPNGLFVEQGPNGQNEEVLMQAPAANQPVNNVQVLQNGQAALPTDPTQTEVYTDVNGNIVDDGTAASLGYTGGGLQGTQVAAGSTVTLNDGTTVANNGNGSINL